MVSLVMNPGRADEQQFRLAPGRVTIGRTKDNAVFCLHKSLSRRHAQVDFDGIRVKVTDLQSKNGIFVNGKRVHEIELLHGDSFRCGDIVFLIEAATTQSPGLAALWPRERAEQTLPSPIIGNTSASSRQPSTPPESVGPDADDQRYKEKLFLLVRASELCVSQLPIADLLRELVALSSQVLEVDRLTLLTLDEATLEMQPAASKTFVPGGHSTYSARVVRRLVENGTPACFADVSRDPSLAGDPAPDAFIRGAMGAPIDPGGGTIGVLYADSLSRVDCFHHDDLSLLRALANLAAVAIESAALRRGAPPA